MGGANLLIFFMIPIVLENFPAILVVWEIHDSLESIVIPRKSNCCTRDSFNPLIISFSSGGLLGSNLFGKIMYSVFETLRESLFADSQSYTFWSSIFIFFISTALLIENEVNELMRFVSSAKSTDFRRSVERGRSLI